MLSNNWLLLVDSGWISWTVTSSRAVLERRMFETLSREASIFESFF